MSEFDYTAPAELYVSHGRSGLRYRRFPKAAEAVRYAIEKLSADVLTGASLEVNDKRYHCQEIRALYESNTYPLIRKSPSVSIAIPRP
jgi:hypothetical protein